jgi:3-oxoacyl-[acyl-carrier protein] reductase
MIDNATMDAGQLFRLDSRVAMITGASSGLGERFAEVAAANGAKVVLVARRAERLHTLKARIEQAGGAACVAVADVTDPAAMKSAFDTAEQAFGTVDLFVANAGINIWERPLETSAKSWHDIMSTNLDAVFFGSQEAARRMIAAGKPGAIVTISSVAGLSVPVIFAAYGISKAAVIQATKLLALELGPKGVRVNCIAPAWVMTEMTEEYLSSPAGQKVGASRPLGRNGQPSDLDGAFLLFASDAGRHITGSTLAVEGGALLGSR